MDYDSRIIKARNLSDIFEIVKEIVYGHLGAEQAGLMVGVTDLGSYQNGFIGAFYSLNSNSIIINKKGLWQEFCRQTLPFTIIICSM